MTFRGVGGREAIANGHDPKHRVPRRLGEQRRQGINSTGRARVCRKVPSLPADGIGVHIVFRLGVRCERSLSSTLAISRKKALKFHELA